MRVIYDCISKEGDRKVNEDCILCDSFDGRYLFALADGLGGHGKGDQASKMVAGKSQEIFRSGAAKNEEMVSACFEQGQKLLIDAQDKSHGFGEMKTTLVLLHFDREAAIWGHIGDSRLYHFHNNKLLQRTSDHSVPQMLVAMGEIKEDAIRHHEDRNKLLRVLGTEWGKSKYDINKADKKLGRGDAFLLCSDGFWEGIDENSMIWLLKKSRSPNQWLMEMEREVIMNSANTNMDNYSAIAVFVR
ncbi:MAG: protein phosphatase 2C domain-containing protein [Eubacteriales bacterium]|nr:protein phosphatase 2C domain-containing protein [Eubacteriales bacterium]